MRQKWKVKIIAIEDITERKLAEKALQNQLNKINLLRKISDKIRQTLDTEKIFESAAIEAGKAFHVDR